MNPKTCIRMTRILLDHHNLQEWSFGWDRALTRFGCCWYETRTITMSKPLVEINRIDVVKNYFLHEVAHALVGSEAGHGPLWRDVAVQIGSDGARGWTSAQVVETPFRYGGWCGSCGTVVRRHRRPSRTLWCQACLVNGIQRRVNLTDLTVLALRAKVRFRRIT